MKSTSGFTLIEVLSSTLIASISILCFYSAQVKDIHLLGETRVQEEAETQAFNIRELLVSEPQPHSFQSAEKIVKEYGKQSLDFPLKIESHSQQIQISLSWQDFLHEKSFASQAVFSVLLEK